MFLRNSITSESYGGHDSDVIEFLKIAFPHLYLEPMPFGQEKVLWGETTLGDIMHKSKLTTYSPLHQPISFSTCQIKVLYLLSSSLTQLCVLTWTISVCRHTYRSQLVDARVRKPELIRDLTVKAVKRWLYRLRRWTVAYKDLSCSESFWQDIRQ